MYIRIAGVFNFEWWVTGCVHNTSVCIKQFMQISEFQFCIFVSPKAQVKPAFIYHDNVCMSGKLANCFKNCVILCTYNSRQCDKMLIDLIKSAKTPVSCLPMELWHSLVTNVSFPQPENHFCATYDRINIVYSFLWWF